MKDEKTKENRVVGSVVVTNANLFLQFPSEEFDIDIGTLPSQRVMCIYQCYLLVLSRWFSLVCSTTFHILRVRSADKKHGTSVATPVAPPPEPQTSLGPNAVIKTQRCKRYESISGIIKRTAAERGRKGAVLQYTRKNRISYSFLVGRSY